MYEVYVNGSLNVDTGTARSAVVHNLTPETTYSITVRARDFYGNNLSEPSNSVTVTTAAINPNDTEPPPPPGNAYARLRSRAEPMPAWRHPVPGARGLETQP